MSGCRVKGLAYACLLYLNDIFFVYGAVGTLGAVGRVLAGPAIFPNVGRVCCGVVWSTAVALWVAVQSVRLFVYFFCCHLRPSPSRGAYRIDRRLGYIGT